MTKEYILNQLKLLNPKYEKEGLSLLGIIGSYAKDTATNDSDIDILYKVDAKKFYTKHNGFKCFSRILEIKDELSSNFKKNIDLCTINQNSNIFKEYTLKDAIYV